MARSAGKRRNGGFDVARRAASRARATSNAAVDPPTTRSADGLGRIDSRAARWASAAILGGVFFWAYWPTVVGLVRAWINVPDYSHGFLVVPLALYFAWARRGSMPPVSDRLDWWGLVLILGSLGLRVFGAMIHWEAFDGWSILPWIGGVIWLFAGRPVFWWSLPSVIFLIFMVPAPYRVEHWLSLPLQYVATQSSVWILQTLGQPAFAEGNTILLGDYHLEVAQACCGLRIFIGIVALGFAFMVLVRSAWWLRVLILISVIPVALASNILRIVSTALLYQYFSGEAAQKFAHDMAGWLTIPVAAALFAGVTWYFSRLIREVDVADVKVLLRQQRG